MKTFLYIVCISSVLLIFGCSKADTEVWRQSTDARYLEEKILTIDSIVQASWETRTVVKGGLGPGTYAYRGYFLVSPEEALAISKNFEWSPIHLTPQFSIKLDDSWPQSQEWLHSPEFNQQSTTASWFGEFYFHPKIHCFILT